MGLASFCSGLLVLSALDLPIEAVPTTNVTLHSLTMSAYSTITSALRTLEACPLVEDVVGSLESRLRTHIAGQDEAVGIVVSAVSAWEMNRRSSGGEPLVMAFTGPTGVGKVGLSVLVSHITEPSPRHPSASLRPSWPRRRPLGGD